MHKLLLPILVFFIVSCSTKNKPLSSMLTTKDAAMYSQLLYKEDVVKTIAANALPISVVFAPREINGNYAVIVKNNSTEQYAVIIRGSKIEFSNAGFQNFIMQDFNIFTMKAWAYADTIKQAYISNGAAIGLQNLLQLKDTATNLSIKEYIEQKLPDNASLLVTGHSLGGNLAYCLAGYLKKQVQHSVVNNMQLITFGAPAVGNAAFVHDLEAKFPKAERYTIDKDIACVFPDMTKVSSLAKIVGLDSAIQLSTLGVSGIPANLGLGDVLKTVGDVLESTNIINTSNKYTQSEKHLRPLVSKDGAATNGLNVEGIFDNIYQYHSIKKYAELLNATVLN